MKAQYTVMLAMLAGAVIGGVAIGGLHAQGKPPGAYAIVDVSEITNPDDYKTLLPKATPSAAAFGGQYIMRTENIISIDGTPPKRFVVIAFDSMEKAKGWRDSASQKEIDTTRLRSSKSREFIVDGQLN